MAGGVEPRRARRRVARLIGRRHPARGPAPGEAVEIWPPLTVRRAPPPGLSARHRPPRDVGPSGPRWRRKHSNFPSAITSPEDGSGQDSTLGLLPRHVFSRPLDEGLEDQGRLLRPPVVTPGAAHHRPTPSSEAPSASTGHPDPRVQLSHHAPAPPSGSAPAATSCSALAHSEQASELPPPGHAAWSTPTMPLGAWSLVRRQLQAESWRPRRSTKPGDPPRGRSCAGTSASSTPSKNHIVRTKGLSKMDGQLRWTTRQRKLGSNTEEAESESRDAHRILASSISTDGQTSSRIYTIDGLTNGHVAWKSTKYSSGSICAKHIAPRDAAEEARAQPTKTASPASFRPVNAPDQRRRPKDHPAGSPSQQLHRPERWRRSRSTAHDGYPSHPPGLPRPDGPDNHHAALPATKSKSIYASAPAGRHLDVAHRDAVSHHRAPQ